MTHYSTMPGSYDPSGDASRLSYTDDVRGIIIGGDGIRYEFWTEEPEPRFIARVFCKNDADAVAWFREEHPAAFQAGAEMRVFDKARNAALAERFNLGRL